MVLTFFFSADKLSWQLDTYNILFFSIRINGVENDLEIVAHIGAKGASLSFIILSIDPISEQEKKIYRINVGIKSNMRIVAISSVRQPQFAFVCLSIRWWRFIFVPYFKVMHTRGMCVCVFYSQLMSAERAIIFIPQKRLLLSLLWLHT